MGWALNQQFGVREVDLARSSRNLPLAIARSTPDDWPGAFGFDGSRRSGRDRLPRELGLSGQPSWQVAVPGTAYGSPCVWKDLVVSPVLEPARGVIALLAVSRRDGSPLWRTELRRDVRMESTKLLGGATPACDGHSIFLAAVASSRLVLFAVDLRGRPRWERDLGPMQAESGRLASPLLHDTLAIVSGDHRGVSWNAWTSTGHLTAVHRLTGEIIWRIRRPNRDSLATPALAAVAGRRQLIVPAPNEIAAYDPADGTRLWTCRWIARRTANSVAWDDGVVFATTRDPQPTTTAIRADGSGDVTNSHVLWQSSAAGSSLLSPVRFENSVVCPHENGLLVSLDAGTGKTQWQRQMTGAFLMQPILTEGELWCLDDGGRAVLVDLAQRGKIISETSLAGGVVGQPAALRSHLLLRTKSGLLCLPWDHAESPLVNTPPGMTNRL